MTSKLIIISRENNEALTIDEPLITEEELSAAIKWVRDDMTPVVAIRSKDEGYTAKGYVRQEAITFINLENVVTMTLFTDEKP